jgi:hypothetical protein
VIGLLLAWSYAAGNGDVTDVMRLVGGLITLLARLIWTARLTPAVSQ